MDTVSPLVLVLPWGAVAILTALLYLAIRQYGLALHTRDDLSGRLAKVEQTLERLTEQVAGIPSSWGSGSHAGHAQAAPAPPSGLPLGSPAPDFALPDLTGQERTLADFAGRPTLAVFFNPGCGYCQKMAPQLGQLAEGGPRVLVIGQGDAEAYRQLAQEHHWRCDVVLDEGGKVASAYQYSGTPTGYLLDAEGRIASDLAIGSDALRRLLPTPPRPAAAQAETNGHANGMAAAAGSVVVRADSSRKGKRR